PALQRSSLLEDRWQCASGKLPIDGAVRQLLVSDDFESTEIRAAFVFNLRPPSLQTLGEVSDFLGVSASAVEELIRRGLLSQPMWDYGFDADELLAARAFLEDLYSAEELEEVVGVSGCAPFLARQRLVEEFQRLPHQAPRFVPQSLADVCDGIAERLDPSQHHTGDQRIGDLVGDDAELFTRAVAMTLSGAVVATQWPSPGRLVDLVISRASVPTVTCNRCLQ